MIVHINPNLESYKILHLHYSQKQVALLYYNQLSLSYLFNLNISSNFTPATASTILTPTCFQYY